MRKGGRERREEQEQEEQEEEETRRDIRITLFTIMDV